MSATLFNNSKYTRWYFNIIQKSKLRSLDGYKEKHHIAPRSVGGSNDSTNLVTLTAKEHYIMHLLLPYMMTDKKHQKKMWSALMCMSNLINKNHHRYIGYSKFYEKAKENINFGEWNIGRKRSQETRLKQSNSVNYRCTEDTAASCFDTT
jgi:hypothetical protein